MRGISGIYLMGTTVLFLYLSHFCPSSCTKKFIFFTLIKVKNTKLPLVLLQFFLFSAVKLISQQSEHPSRTGRRTVTALTFNVSSWMAGTQNLPGRQVHCCSQGADSRRPWDLLETAICWTGGTKEGLQIFSREEYSISLELPHFIHVWSRWHYVETVAEA